MKIKSSYIIDLMRIKTYVALLLGFLGCACVQALSAQAAFLDHWQQRVIKTQAEQPHWVTPLVTITPRLEQELRADVLRQIQPNGTATWNYDNGKGLELIPQRRLEFIVNVPPYLQHNSPTVKDGAGDESFLMKYRFYASNEQHSNGIVTAFLAGSIPTGSYKNGATDAIVSPTIAAGKGYGRWDVQSTLGAALPVHNVDTIGRPVTWNTALQYHAGVYLWPELEFNSTWFNGGANDGKMQNFATPGLIGRFPLHNRIALVVGSGIQIATSQFHTFNHGLIFTVRMPF